DTLLSPVGLGIIFGLVVGKQLGIMLFSWAAVRAGVADLPEGVSWRHIWGASWLAGIGFTMALFIDSLAFDGEPALLNSAKVAILVASLISGVVGYLILRTTAPVDEMSTGPAGAVQAPAQG
ncbi:MAG: Na+/H+ antiporter NhaA, partial [Anaerolineae bacterium]|nr:Na+/H+ antiporter NhaA [Anaerolineae bacterium]